MRYMGSKRRIADEILPIILKGRKPNQWFVEPFCGGCNITERVTGKRIANDIHPELIAMYKALQSGWLPPKRISEEEYKRIMAAGSPELKGYAGFTHSFGAVYGGTYRREVHRSGVVTGTGIKLKSNYANMEYVGNFSRVQALDQIKLLKNVKFINGPYYDLEIPKNSIVYCDPPYAGTSEYVTAKFNSANFFQWCRVQKEEGHIVFVSEYNAPDDFKCVWGREVKTHLNSHRGKAFSVTEKLFTL